MLRKINIWFIKHFGIGLHRFPNLRASALAVKKKFKKGIVCAEIGAYNGENAFFMLEKLNIKKLYIIDPYEDYEGYKEVETKQKLSGAFKKMQKKLKKYEKKIVFIKKFSSDAVNDLPDHMDYIYIDGNHEYKYVKKDIENYYKKLKRGGILGGHDLQLPDVEKAYLEFVAERKLKPHCGPNIITVDWWMVKK